jgi:hypothetical protein
VIEMSVGKMGASANPSIAAPAMLKTSPAFHHSIAAATGASPSPVRKMARRPIVAESWPKTTRPAVSDAQ